MSPKRRYTGVLTHMTPIELKLAIKLLQMASDEFSNHSCNDYHLVKEGGLTEEEAREVQESLVKDGWKDELTKNLYSSDWLLMDWIAGKLKKLAD